MTEETERRRKPLTPGERATLRAARDAGLSGTGEAGAILADPASATEAPSREAAIALLRRFNVCDRDTHAAVRLGCGEIGWIGHVRTAEAIEAAIATLLAPIEKAEAVAAALRAERDDADRRAGAAERRLAQLEGSGLAARLARAEGGA